MEAKQGIDLILLYRLLSKASAEDAWKLAFQTEHDNSKSRDFESTPTKDGIIQTPGLIEYDFSATSIIAKGDKHIEEIEKAFDDHELLEIWEIDKAEKDEQGKYKATYYQGYVSNFGTTANSEDALELELEFAINGIGQKGLATLNAEQEEVVQYVFKDTVKETPQEP